MRAFYRLPASVDLTALPDVVTLAVTTDQVWVLSATDPRLDLEAVGGVRLGARLSELAGADLDAVATVRVQRSPDPDTGILDVPPSQVLATDTVLIPATPKTIFAGDAVEDYR